MFTIDRRGFLASAGAWFLIAAADPALKPLPLTLGPSQPFNFDRLKQRASELAAQTYRAPVAPAAAVIERIDFDTMQKIRFRPDYALWRGGREPYPVSFFPLNRYASTPVKISVVADGNAREIAYLPDYFDFDGTGLETRLPAGAGFSGFRVMDNQTSITDWLAFQGASYFRSSGSDAQYGASARGIAINTALSTAEEFPRFSEFWLEEKDATLTIYALLDGPSITGAYRFDATKNDAVVMNVHAELFTREAITRLGVAPLTSMYWYGENLRERAEDWRPEIHDSDGLAMWTGGGERIWRPLNNPAALQVNSFVDKSPKGFGLMQRDRVFENYEDDGAFYNRRPGIWVEPKGDWGEGSIQLVEIPTDDEVHDNIVAYWQPKASIGAGDSFNLDYTLYWQHREPNYPANVARVVGTRIGRGGIPGASPPPVNVRKFVVDFEGGPLSEMEARFDVTPVVTVSRGMLDKPYVIKVVGTNRWRAVFDVIADGRDVINLRCFLRLNDKPLSETWLYQYFPSLPAK